jgi:hypothetical protein
VSEYPECERLTAAAEQTQVIGEFIDWLQGQGIQLMTYREDLSDIRPTISASDTGGANYWETHCLHWHGAARDADDNIQEQGTCCWCGMGREYTLTTRGWVHEQRGTEHLLADWAGIDPQKVEAERRRMLASLPAAGNGPEEG